MLGGLGGALIEAHDGYTRVTKGDIEAIVRPPRTCVILWNKKSVATTANPMLFPTMSIAAHHVRPPPSLGHWSSSEDD